MKKLSYLCLFTQLSYATYLLNAPIWLPLGFLILGLVALVVPQKEVQGFLLAHRVATLTTEREGGKKNLSVAEVADVHKATREVLQKMSVDEVMSWVNIGK